MKKIIIVLGFCIATVGCQEKVLQSSSDEVQSVSMATVESVEAAASADMQTPPPAPKIDTNKDGKIATKIIKNGDLRFESSDLEKTYANLVLNIKKTNAVIQSDAESKSDYGMSRNLTIRIPSQNFDAFITDISKGVSYFDRKEISARDVTAEYIDTDARISSKKKLEIRYLELLKKANKVSEMLEIEKQLSEIREEIEAKEGQLKYLQSQVSMSTINIEFYKNIATEGGVRVSFFQKIWNAIVSGFNSVGVFLLNLLEIWPYVLATLGIIYLIRKGYLRKKSA